MKKLSLLLMALVFFCTACEIAEQQQPPAEDLHLAYAEQKSERLQQQYDELWAESNALELELAEALARNEDLEQQLANQRADNSGWAEERQEFERISGDLRAHPELIPFAGILGGTPAFGEINLLTEPWWAEQHGGFAHASAEDGHWMAELLYYFAPDENGVIEWTLLASNLDGLEIYP